MQVTKNTIVIRVIGNSGFQKTLFTEQNEDNICLELSSFKSLLRGLGAVMEVRYKDGRPNEN